MKVLLTDQVFPSVEIERTLLSEAGHELVIATSEKRQGSTWWTRMLY